MDVFKTSCGRLGKTAVLLMVNVYKHVSFARLMSPRIRTVISTVVLVMQNLNLGKITTEIKFAIDTTNKTWNFKNMSGN